MLPAAFADAVRRACLPLVVVAAPLSAQVSPGLRLIDPLDVPETYLVDTSDVIVHRWQSQYLAGHSCYVEPDGTLIRAIRTPGGFHPQYAGGGIERLALDGSVKWHWVYTGPNNPTSHHDIEVLPNGNVLVIAYEEKSYQETIGAGRPASMYRPGSPFRPDHVVEVMQTGPTTGQIVWSWHAWDHIIQDFDAAKPNYGVVGDNPQLIDLNYPITAPVFGDWIHMNSVDYDEVNDWIVLSAREQNEIWIIDHSTTTAEAAGHTGGRMGRGGDLLYRWGNPAAYRKGGPADQKLFGQHSAVVVPQGYPGAGNIVVFNNNNPGGSSVDEIVLPIDASGQFVLRADGTYGPDSPVWSFQQPGFQSEIISSCERLPNGNTLVCSGVQSWVFEVTPSGQMVAEHKSLNQTVFRSQYVERSLWIDESEISRGAGGTATFDLMGGSRLAGASYLVLGSLSGNTPGIAIGNRTLPLNADSYFFATLSSPFALLSQSVGTVDAAGRAQASFTLPPAVLPDVFDGVGFDHAFVVADWTTGVIHDFSNAATFRITP